MTTHSSPVWKWTSDALTEKMVLSAERALNVKLPADYRACVRENHGGAPEPAGFVFVSPDGQEVASQVSLLLTLDSREDENVLSTTRDLKAEGRLPEGLVPIIDDGGGNYVCLDYGKGTPGIVHLSIASQVTHLAESFTEFLQKLK